MKLFLKNIFFFLTGGALYSLLEILWRGKSHPSMFAVGGFCFLVLLDISKLNIPLLIKSVIGCLAITVTEFFCGIVLNKVLSLNVWDYSSVPFNLMGQICLPYSVIWLLLSFTVIYTANKYLNI